MRSQPSASMVSLVACLVAEVAGHHVGALEPQLAGLAETLCGNADFVAGGGIDESGLRVGRRPACGADGCDGAEETLAAVERSAVADGAELGHAVPLHHAGSRCGRRRRGPGLRPAAPRRTARARSVERSYLSTNGCLASATATGGAMKATVTLWSCDVAEKLLEIEAGHHDQARPRLQDGVEQHRHSVDVEERQNAMTTSSALDVLHRAGLRDVGHQVAVGQHDALGVAGRTGASRAARRGGSPGRS